MLRFLLAVVSTLPLFVAAAASGKSGRPRVTVAPGPCSVFTPAEITKQFGIRVGPGEPAGLGTGCQWPATDNDSAFAMTQVIPDTSAWSNPIAAPSYQKVTGINGEGFSVKDPQGGWRAEARNGKGAYVVMLIGAASASREGAVALLRKLLERS